MGGSGPSGSGGTAGTGGTMGTGGSMQGGGGSTGGAPPVTMAERSSSTTRSGKTPPAPTSIRRGAACCASATRITGTASDMATTRATPGTRCQLSRQSPPTPRPTSSMETGNGLQAREHGRVVRPLGSCITRRQRDTFWLRKGAADCTSRPATRRPGLSSTTTSDESPRYRHG